MAKAWEVNGPECVYLSHLFSGTEVENACKEILNIFNGLTGTVLTYVADAIGMWGVSGRYSSGLDRLV